MGGAGTPLCPRALAPGETVTLQPPSAPALSSLCGADPALRRMGATGRHPVGAGDRDAPEDHAGDVSILRDFQSSVSKGLDPQLAGG